MSIVPAAWMALCSLYFSAKSRLTAAAGHLPIPVISLILLGSLLTACGGEAPPTGQNALTAVITASAQSGVAPLMVQLSGANSTGAEIVEYRWQMGAATAAGPEWQWTFEAAGSYRVRLEVVNAAGEIAETAIAIDVLASSATFDLGGIIEAPAGLDSDGDTNDPQAVLRANNGATEAEVQAVANPLLLNGFVTQRPTGAVGTRFEKVTDIDDVYEASFSAGDFVSLRIFDFSTADLDLYLLDPNDFSLVAISINTGEYESLRVPADGRYYVQVRAVEGSSNYVLKFDTQSLLTGALANGSGSDFIPYEAIVKRRAAAPSLATVGAGGAMVQRAQVRLPGSAPTREQRISINHDNPQTRAGVGLSQQALPETFAAANPQTRAKLETLRAIKRLRADDDMGLAEPNFRVRPMLEPTDPGYQYQWHYPAIGLPAAWDHTLGNAEVVVAVIDTGVHMTHPELREQLLPGFDFVSNPTAGADGDGLDPDPSDPGNAAVVGDSTWHGTHVAATIAARWGNGEGGVGVAPGVRVMPLRAIGRGDGSLYDVLQAVRYAAGLPNDSGALPEVPAAVINLSLGGDGYSQAAQDLFRQVRAQGVIVVASVGNEGTDQVLYPAAYDSVIAVGAVDLAGERAPYSNHNFSLDVMAPGGHIDADLDGDGRADGVYSAVAQARGGQLEPGYGLYQGTSMAAAHVSAIAALMRSLAPELSPETFAALLAAGELTYDSGNRDDFYGYGLIDAEKSVMAALALAGQPVASALKLEPAAVFIAATADFATVRVLADGAAVSAAADVPWLSLERGPQAELWSLRIDRQGLAPGLYHASVVFDAVTGARARLPITARVGASQGLGNAGKLYVTLYSADGATALRTIDALADADGRYHYLFTAVPIGDYVVTGSTDVDYDGELCEPGEICGSFASAVQLTPLVVERERLDLDFTVRLETIFAVGETDALPAALP